MRGTLILALALAGALALAASPAPPAALEPHAADSLRGAIERGRRDTEEWLRSGATSYLAAAQRRDFGDRARLTVGRAADNDIRLEADSVAARHLAVSVEGDSFRVEALDPGVAFRAGGHALRSAVLPPGSIGIGRFTLRLSHQRFPAIIVFDPRSPRLARYKGLRHFPVDLAYRFALPLLPDPSPDTVVILSTRGNSRRAIRAGWFEFALQGRACRLEAVRLLEPGLDEQSLGVYFRDATTGRQTYALGRYLEASPLPGGDYLLDFNLAYNPACAFSPHYNCPIPPRANTLGVAIRAGERDSRYAAH